MGPEKPEFRLDLWPERPDLRPERPDLRPERPDVGGMDERKDRRMNKRKSPCVLQDFIPFRAAAQKAGQRVSLTTYCPWVTG